MSLLCLVGLFGLACRPLSQFSENVLFRRSGVTPWHFDVGSLYVDLVSAYRDLMALFFVGIGDAVGRRFDWFIRFQYYT